MPSFPIGLTWLIDTLILLMHGNATGCCNYCIVHSVRRAEHTCMSDMIGIKAIEKASV